MDLHSKKIIGYAYGTTMTEELALKAVENACLNIIDTEGIILHSDLGSQYTSQLFDNYVNFKLIIHSFSRKGNPYDNVVMDSFYRTIKRELIQDAKYENPEQAQKDIFKYIEMYYSIKRIHSALGYIFLLKASTTSNLAQSLL